MTTQSAPLTASSGSPPRRIAAPDDLIQSVSGFFGASSGGRRDPQAEFEARRGVHPGGEHVVGVAAPRHGAAADRAAMLLEGHDVGHDLAGMRAPRQAVDDRHGRGARELGHGVGIERADHDGVDIARQHARGVGDGLAAAELHLVGGEHDRVAAELAHGDLEGHAGAGRGPLEDHRQRPAGERAVGTPALGLHGAARLDHPAQLGRRDIDEVEKMADGALIRPLPASAAWPAAAPGARRRGRAAQSPRRSPLRR